MYETYYGLRENPFTLKADPRLMYLGEMHTAALGMLEYAIVQNAAFCVITGEIGSGKTTLVASVLDQIRGELNVSHLTFVHPDMGSILAWALYGFGQDYESSSKIELYDRLSKFCKKQMARKRRNLLLVDEAQNLTIAQLEEIRTIANLSFGNVPAVQVIFVGQPEFRKTLSAPELEQLRQRVAVDYAIEHLGLSETSAYISHRLASCGRTRRIFSPESIEFIFTLTGGIPRKINIVCDTLLSYGYLDEKDEIMRAYAIEVMKDRTKSGMVALGIAGNG